MKISYLLSFDFPEGFSTNARVKAYAKGSRHLNNDVDIVVGYSTRFNELNVNSKVKGIWEGIPYKFVSGTTKYYKSVWGKLFIFARFAFGLTWHFVTHRNPKRIWVVCNVSLKDYLFAIPLLKLMGQKQVVIYTELPSLLSNSFINRLTEKWLVKYPEKLLVVSDNLYQHFQQKGANVKKIVPIVVDEKRFATAKYKSSKTIGYLGTFSPKDDISFVIEGFLEAKKQIKELKLLLMGHIPTDEARAQVSKVCLIHNDIEYLGMIPFDEIPEKLSFCDTLVMNRTDSVYARTGFPIKLAEYMATGIPVMVTKFEEYLQYFDEEMVYFYAPDQLQEFATAIVKRYGEEDKALIKAKKARLTIKDIFGQEMANSELQAIFEEISNLK